MTPPEPGAAIKRGALITPRQSLVVAAVVLSLILVGVLAYLYIYLGGRTTGVIRGGSAHGGLAPVVTILGPGSGPHPTFARPMGVAVNSRGRIYVTDADNHRVCVFDRDGRFLFEFGGRGIAKPWPGVNPTWEPGLLNYPVGVDVDDEDFVYVADFRNDQIQVFTPEGAFVRRFPDPNRTVGKGSSGQDQQGIAVTDVVVSEGRVYATDVYQVFVFTTTGELVEQFGRPGVGPGDLDHPNGIAVGRGGVVYVADSNHARITAFDRDRDVLWNFGDIPAGPDPFGPLPELGLPRGMAMMADGSLLIADGLEFELVRVSPSGKFMRRYGEPGTQPGQLSVPNDVDTLGDSVVIADSENARVQVVNLAE